MKGRGTKRQHIGTRASRQSRVALTFENAPESRGGLWRVGCSSTSACGAAHFRRQPAVFTPFSSGPAKATPFTAPRDAREGFYRRFPTGGRRRGDVMHSQTMTADVFYGADDETRSFRGWLTFAGIALLLTGVAAIAHDVTATRVSVIVIGWLLIAAGATQIIHSFYVRSWSGFFLYLLDGVIRTSVGVMLVVYPHAGAEAITLLLSLYLIVVGGFKAIASIVMKLPNFGWSVASGVISFALGVILAMPWPQVSVWFLGFAVGVDMVFDGWALLMFAAATKKLAPSYT